MQQIHHSIAKEQLSPSATQINGLVTTLLATFLIGDEPTNTSMTSSMMLAKPL